MDCPEASGHLKVARVAPQVRVAGQPAQVDLEVVVVDRVKPGQGHPEPDVGLGDRVTEQVPAAGQALLQVVQGGEDPGYRVVVSLLGGGGCNPAAAAAIPCRSPSPCRSLHQAADR